MLANAIAWNNRRSRIATFALGLLIFAALLLATGTSPATVGAILLYFVPVFVAALRSKTHPGGVVVVNILLGWTVIGWIVALAMAASGPVTKDVVPSVPTTSPRAGSTGSGLVVIGVILVVVVGLYGLANAFSTTPRTAGTIASATPGTASTQAPVATAALAATAAAAAVPTAVPATPHIGSTVRAGNWQYRVVQVDTAKSLRWGSSDFTVMTPKGIWVAVMLDLTNIGDRNFTLNDWDLELWDGKTIKYDPNYESSLYSHSIGQSALGEQMPPSVTVRVTLLFDVAPGTTGMKLHLVQGGPDIRLE